MKKFSKNDSERRIIESLHSLMIRLQDYQKSNDTTDLIKNKTIETKSRFLVTYLNGIFKF